MITSIIIHYKRPENIRKVIDGIKKQTVKSEIIVWDNSGDYPANSGEDVLVRCSKNIFCQARVLISGIVKTKYIYNQDDDLAIKDSNMFEKFIEVSTKYPDMVIGWNGRIAEHIKNWEKAYSFPGGSWCDAMDINNADSISMINYGVSFLRTELINQLPINPFGEVTEEELKYGDDIWVSKYFKKKRTMPFKLLEHYEWLNEYQERGSALSKQGPHMAVRDRLMKRFFKDAK